MPGRSASCAPVSTGSDWATSETASPSAAGSRNCESISALGTGSTTDGKARWWWFCFAAEARGRRPGTLLLPRDRGRSIWMPRTTVKTESYRESLLESLRNPEEAAQYLNACLEDEDARVFLLALRDVADARGGIRSLSRDAHLNRESLYRMLSKSGNPSLDSLAAVLNACGLRLAVQSTAPRRGKRRIA